MGAVPVTLLRTRHNDEARPDRAETAAFLLIGRWLEARSKDEGRSALTELMDMTRNRVFWVLSSATSAYRHLCQTRFFDQHLGAVIGLGRWSENEIRELIQRRQRAAGIEASFEDLIVHAVEGDRLPTQVVETEEGYIRLLWNFAEGNPRERVKVVEREEMVSVSREGVTEPVSSPV